MRNGTEAIGTILGLALIVLLLVGEVKCFIKMVKCNWDPVGKSEIIYTASFFTGFGGVVGYFDIDDK